MILGSEIVNGFDSAWNLPSLPFMPDFKVINMNSNIDDCCYMPADTISDSDVCNSSVGPLAIIMLVTFFQSAGRHNRRGDEEARVVFVAGAER